jgi:hypothetical protein
MYVIRPNVYRVKIIAPVCRLFIYRFRYYPALLVIQNNRGVRHIVLHPLFQYRMRIPIDGAIHVFVIVGIDRPALIAMEPRSIRPKSYQIG